MWTLSQAVSVIQDIEPLVRELGYHSLLAGSVLHRGQSEKDLDVWFIPLNGYENQPEDVLKLLKGIWGHCDALRDGPDYHTGSLYHCREMVKFTVFGKRIDVFIV